MDWALEYTSEKLKADRGVVVAALVTASSQRRLLFANSTRDDSLYRLFGCLFLYGMNNCNIIQIDLCL